MIKQFSIEVQGDQAYYPTAPDHVTAIEKLLSILPDGDYHLTVTMKGQWDTVVFTIQNRLLWKGDELVKTLVRCPYCFRFGGKYQGEFAAPGYGQSYHCPACQNNYAVYGRTAEKHARIFEPGDVE